MLKKKIAIGGKIKKMLLGICPELSVVKTAIRSNAATARVTVSVSFVGSLGCNDDRWIIIFIWSRLEFCLQTVIRLNAQRQDNKRTVKQKWPQCPWAPIVANLPYHFLGYSQLSPQREDIGSIPEDAQTPSPYRWATIPRTSSTFATRQKFNTLESLLIRFPAC